MRGLELRNVHGKVALHLAASTGKIVAVRELPLLPCEPLTSPHLPSPSLISSPLPSQPLTPSTAPHVTYLRAAGDSFGRRHDD